MEVETTDGRVRRSRIDVPKGDPGNSLTRDEIVAKAIKLATFSGAATEAEARAAIDRVWELERQDPIGGLVNRNG